MIFCFGCMAMTGSDVREVLARFIDRTFMVHVRDVVIHADGQVDEVFPGTGQVRPDTAIALLHRTRLSRRDRAGTPAEGLRRAQERDLDGLGGGLLPRRTRHPHIVASPAGLCPVAGRARRLGDAVATARDRPDWCSKWTGGKSIMRAYRIPRRQFLATLSTGALAILAAACSSNDQSIVLPTKTPAPAGAGERRRAASAASAAASAAAVRQRRHRRMCPTVPRNQTLILSVSDSINQMTDTEIRTRSS